MSPLPTLKTPTKPLQSGFMMIEVLIAILLFSVGLLGMIALQTATVQNATNAEYRTMAATLANDIVTQMWIRKTDDPTAAGLAADITNWKTKVQNSDLPNATGTVEKSAGVTSVIITYKVPSKQDTENASRYLTQVVVPQ